MFLFLNNAEYFLDKIWLHVRLKDDDIIYYITIDYRRRKEKYSIKFVFELL